MQNIDYIQMEWEWLVRMRLADQDPEQAEYYQTVGEAAAVVR